MKNRFWLVTTLYIILFSLLLALLYYDGHRLASVWLLTFLLLLALGGVYYLLFQQQKTWWQQRWEQAELVRLVLKIMDGQVMAEEAWEIFVRFQKNLVGSWAAAIIKFDDEYEWQIIAGDRQIASRFSPAIQEAIRRLKRAEGDYRYLSEPIPLGWNKLYASCYGDLLLVNICCRQKCLLDDSELANHFRQNLRRFLQAGIITPVLQAEQAYLLGLLFLMLMSGSQIGTVVVREEGEEGFRLLAHWGLGEEASLSRQTVGLLSLVCASGETLNLGTASQTVQLDLLSPEYSDILVVPIRIDGTTRGALLIGNRVKAEDSKRPYPPEIVMVATLIAEKMGAILKHELMHQAIKARFLATIQALVQALEARDRYTKGHSENVARYARIIAEEMGLTAQQKENIYLAGLLHDIGKIGVPELILNKPGRLTEEERVVIRQHPVTSRRILEAIPEMQGILQAVEQHHERWDGLGYPAGIAGEDIDLGARIIAVADAFDAMTSDRIYQKGRTAEQALEELVRGAGAQWDPQIVDVFLNWWERTNKKSVVNWKLKFTRRIYRDILASVTQSKLHLAEKEEMLDFWHKLNLGEWLEVKEARDLGQLREHFQIWLQVRQYPEKRSKELLLILSELATNALKHARGGQVNWGLDDRDNLYIVVRDEGSGFEVEKLPQSLLVKGFSTKKSLGYGFSVILEHCNKVYLATDSTGSIVMVECGKSRMEVTGTL
ncbi:HDIG domain-containing protein [Carboxydocella thermautotrophica]|nr:HDIG domain-containing protein [Carboxydocella thermautotrophica]